MHCLMCLPQTVLLDRQFCCFMILSSSDEQSISSQMPMVQDTACSFVIQDAIESRVISFWPFFHFVLFMGHAVFIQHGYLYYVVC